MQPRPPPGSLPTAFIAKPSFSPTQMRPVDRAWWRAFASPELDALETEALTASLDLRAAIARVEEARALQQVAGEPLLPTFDVQGEAATRKGGPLGARALGAGVASYEIDFWGRNRAIAGSARETAAAAAFDRRTVEVTLCADVADAYFDVLALRARLDLARRIATEARRLLSLVEIQQRVGTGAELQTQLQRNLAASFDQSAASVERQLEQTQHRLAVLVGRPPEGFFAGPIGAPAPLTPAVSAHAPARLLTARPDIAAAEARLAAANLDVRAARTAFLPNVTLAAAAGVAGSPTTMFGLASAGLVQPFFHGGALRGRLRYDQAHAKELEAAYRQTVLTALRDVEDGLSAQARLQQEDDAASVATAAADRAAFLAAAQYRLGASDYLTVLTAQRALYQARDSQLQIHALRLQAAAGLYRALGGGVLQGAA